MNPEKDKSQPINKGLFYDFGKVSLTIIFWETDTNLKITYINSALQNLTGVSFSCVGASLSDVMTPDDKRVWEEAIRATNGKYQNILFTLKSSHSQLIKVRVNGSSITSEGDVVGYYGICSIENNDTLKKEVINRLQRINKTILSSLSEVIVIVDKNNKFTLVSPNFYKMWGFNRDEFFLLSVPEVLKKMQNYLSPSSLLTLPSFSEDFNSPNRTKHTLKFKNGRIIESTSSPHIVDGKIEGRCWSFKDVSKQSYLVDKLSGLAFRDSLTKLYNRRWCEKKLKQLLKRKTNSSMAFLYMDLDHFKVINDSCGHLHGDEALEQISAVFLNVFGKKSLLARLGGDEFGLILLDKSHSQVTELANQIKYTLSNYTYLWKKKIFKIGLSIGIVFIEKEDDFRTIFVHADEACYQSKKTGKNKYTIYNEEKDVFQKTQTELKWYDAIQKSLLNGKFELWCQPIKDQENTSRHYEILLRMKSEEGKIISPAMFMGSADRFGMMYTIDKLVVDSFCRFYKDNANVVKNILFSINLSGHSLSRDTFLKFVLDCFKKYRVDCNNICFEITENEIIKNLDKALVFIKKVRGLGCKISLDDFGRGLTSFSYLKNIPFDFIKIDGQFVKELNDDKINAAIIKSIVYIAEVMGKKTIAEHIESESVLKQVTDLGVDYFQGYYFSEPHQITKLLE